MTFVNKIYRVLGAALLLAMAPGCLVNVEEPKPKKGVDVKVERDGKGLDIDVDVNTPARP